MSIRLPILETRDALRRWRRDAAGRVGLVPTMGSLHAGHLALVRAARRDCDRVIASIFVNPRQFGPGEDLDSYPRTLEADVEALESVGVDAVFAPTVVGMYPFGEAGATIQLHDLADMLCGSRRPGHFDGVATVVAKLFNLVRPDAAYFGEKDYQQLVVIRRLVDDLFMGLDVVGVPTVREDSGLAMSSRNQYLDADQRERAAALAAALEQCRRHLDAGERDFDTLEARGRGQLEAAGFEPDYFEIRTPALARPDARSDRFRILAAGHLGKARLIDNLAAP